MFPCLIEVACGAASRLRLKHPNDVLTRKNFRRRMWSGFSSEIETFATDAAWDVFVRRMWSGFSSEIERAIASMMGSA